MAPHRNGLSNPFGRVKAALQAKGARMETSLSSAEGLRRLREYQWSRKDIAWIIHGVNALIWLTLMEVPSFPLKLLIPLLYFLGILIPLTSQFFIPATPIFSYLLTFYSCRFIPTNWRPAVSVVTLPTLESVLYGANVSDILTRFTHPILDVLAWVPYGILHFTLPFIVAGILWLFAPKGTLQFYSKVFGFMNIFGVWVQIIFPCAPPWYEVIYGLIPASYNTPGSAAGLARIDSIFGTRGYQTAFGGAPVVFGAFPSLHSADATIEALFIGHFFPSLRRLAWGYVAILYWSTMYLTHHYLIDVVGGACLSITFFYAFMPEELRFVSSNIKNVGANGYMGIGRGGRSKYEAYDLDTRGSRRTGGTGIPPSPGDSSGRNSLDGLDNEEQDITFTYAARSPRPPGSAAPFIVPSPIVAGGSDAPSGWPRAPGADRVAKSHRHTASIASLIRADQRAGEGGWSPLSASFPQNVNSNRPS